VVILFLWSTCVHFALEINTKSFNLSNCYFNVLQKISLICELAMKTMSQVGTNNLCKQIGI
jgi:hypothetical protein